MYQHLVLKSVVKLLLLENKPWTFYRIQRQHIKVGSTQAWFNDKVSSFSEDWPNNPDLNPLDNMCNSFRAYGLFKTTSKYWFFKVSGEELSNGGSVMQYETSKRRSFWILIFFCIIYSRLCCVTCVDIKMNNCFY